MLEIAVDIALVVLMLAAALCLYRVAAGPSLPDRLLGLDTGSAVLMGLIVVVAVRYQQAAYYDAVLIIAMLVFLGTVVVAKYIGTGSPVDRDDS